MPSDWPADLIARMDHMLLKAARALLEAGTAWLETSAGVKVVEERMANQSRGRCRMHVPPSTA